MRRIRLFLASYGLDVLVVAAALQSAVGVALLDDGEAPEGTRLWVEAVVMGAVVLALVLRRHYPLRPPRDCG